MSNTKNKMPVVFVGHGSPMNAIENNEYTKAWEKLAESIPKPKAIVSVSAHYTTRGTAVTAMEKPPTIHDFGGFPQALFDVEYPADGNPELAKLIKENVKKADIMLDNNEWGLDHGTWSVLRKMYPKADIPVIELSIDYFKPAQYHYELGKELAFLRDMGVLVFANGNIVHNLKEVDFYNMDNAYDWTKRFDEFIKDSIVSGNHHAVINYEKFGRDALLSVPTPEHYYPLLYILALQEKEDKVSFPVEGLMAGSLSMRSVLIG